EQVDQLLHARGSESAAKLTEPRPIAQITVRRRRADCLCSPQWMHAGTADARHAARDSYVTGTGKPLREQAVTRVSCPGDSSTVVYAGRMAVPRRVWRPGRLSQRCA